MPDDEHVTFYRLQACPFCERVARLLREYEVPYRSRYVEPMHSRSVPVIVDERTGVTMAESGNIVAYLDAEYGDAAADGDTDVVTDGGTDVMSDGGADADSAGGAR